MEIKRGDIFLAKLGHIGVPDSVQRGTRPVLIVSNNLANRYSPTVTIVPLSKKTDKKPSQPTHVIVKRTPKNRLLSDSMAFAEQITALDKSYLIEKKGCIDNPLVMSKITEAIQKQVGAIPVYEGWGGKDDCN